MTETYEVKSLVKPPEGAVLARWSQLKKGDRYQSPYDGVRYTREATSIESYYTSGNRDPLVFAWPAPPPPITVTVDVDVLEAVLNANPMRPTTGELAGIHAQIAKARAEAGS